MHVDTSMGTVMRLSRPTRSIHRRTLTDYAATLRRESQLCWERACLCVLGSSCLIIGLECC